MPHKIHSGGNPGDGGQGPAHAAGVGKAGGADLFIANRNKRGWTRLWRSYAFALPICMYPFGSGGKRV